MYINIWNRAFHIKIIAALFPRTKIPKILRGRILRRRQHSQISFCIWALGWDVFSSVSLVSLISLLRFAIKRRACNFFPDVYVSKRYVFLLIASNFTCVLCTVLLKYINIWCAGINLLFAQTTGLPIYNANESSRSPGFEFLSNLKSLIFHGLCHCGGNRAM